MRVSIVCTEDDLSNVGVISSTLAEIANFAFEKIRPGEKFKLLKIDKRAHEVMFSFCSADDKPGLFELAHPITSQFDD